MQTSMKNDNDIVTTNQITAYDLPHADGSPSGTFGPQSPVPIGNEPLASEKGIASAENGAAVSSRSVPNRSSFGFSYMVSPAGSPAESGNDYASRLRP
jgi:hypothetical protein